MKMGDEIRDSMFAMITEASPLRPDSYDRRRDHDESSAEEVVAEACE